MTKLKTLWIIIGFTLCSLVLADFPGHHGHHGHHDHHEHHEHHHDDQKDDDKPSVDHHEDVNPAENVKSVATGKLALPNLKDCKNRKLHSVSKLSKNVRRQHDHVSSSDLEHLDLKYNLYLST